MRLVSFRMGGSGMESKTQTMPRSLRCLKDVPIGTARGNGILVEPFGDGYAVMRQTEAGKELLVWFHTEGLAEDAARKLMFPDAKDE